MVYQMTEAFCLTNNTLHNDHLHAKLFEQRRVLYATQQLPTPAKMNEEEMQRTKNKREKCFVVVAVCLIFQNFFN